MKEQFVSRRHSKSRWTHLLAPGLIQLPAEIGTASDNSSAILQFQRNGPQLLIFINELLMSAEEEYPRWRCSSCLQTAALHRRGYLSSSHCLAPEGHKMS